MKYSVYLLALLATQIFAQDFEGARDMCTKYGFIPNTQPFAQCVQTEVMKSQDGNSCNRMKKAIEDETSFCFVECKRQNGIHSTLPCMRMCQSKSQPLPYNCY
jgi:hypothetical protein